MKHVIVLRCLKVIHDRKSQTYFNIEQDSNDVSHANEHRIYFSNYIIHE